MMAGLFNETNTFEASKVTQPGSDPSLVNLEVNGKTFEGRRRIQDGRFGNRSMSHTYVWEPNTPDILWKVWWWDDNLVLPSI